MGISITVRGTRSVKLSQSCPFLMLNSMPFSKLGNSQYFRRYQRKTKYLLFRFNFFLTLFLFVWKNKEYFFMATFWAKQESIYRFPVRRFVFEKPIINCIFLNTVLYILFLRLKAFNLPSLVMYHTCP